MSHRSDLSTKIAETVPIFFFICSLDNEEIEFISPQFFEVAHGIKKGDKEALKKCIHPEDRQRFSSFFADLSPKNNYEGSVELRVSNVLPDIEWVEINIFPLREHQPPQTPQVVGHMVDITQKKRIYDTLHKEKEHLSNLLNMLVHDLRAPFNRVQMIAELLETNMTEAEYEKHKPYLSMLHRQGKQSLSLIQSLLRLATLKGQASSLDLNVHDLRNLIEESVSRQQVRIEKKKLKVEYHFPEAHVKAKVDAVLFLQVLGNLLSNAIKYTPTGGSIHFGLAYVQKHVELKVRDTGIGIPEKHLKTLFHNLQGLRRPGLEGEESTGLGLFICKEIVNMHHGDIKVDSTEDEGSVFTVTLPLPESSAVYY